ncbi:MAG: choice-of-anchor Q domain-containing protein [Bacteroidota bacterium]
MNALINLYLSAIKTIILFSILQINGVFAQKIIFVDNDATGYNNGLKWEDAFKNLHEALLSAESGDQVWIAKGVYKPINCYPCSEDDREVTFTIPNGVKVYGGFNGDESHTIQRKIDTFSLFVEHPTILSGDIGVPNYFADNSFTIIKSSGVDTSTQIDGVIISSGNSNYDPYFRSSLNSGGGLFLNNQVLKIKNCKIRANRSYYGGALYLNRSNVTIENCYFQENHSFIQGGAILLVNNSLASLKHSCLTKNKSNQGGGAIFNKASELILNTCVVKNNSAQIGGGVNNQEGLVQILNTSLLQNEAQIVGGGINSESGNEILRLCTFHKNFAGNGGAINSNNGTLNINFCTIYQNISSSSGGGVLVTSKKTTIRGSIISKNIANSSPDLLGTNSEIISLGYNLLGDPQGSNFLPLSSDILGSSGNPIDPRLDSLKKNGGLTPTLALLPGSPAIGRGPPISSNQALVDQRGYSRVIGSKSDNIDIGAFEYQETYVSQELAQLCENDEAFFSIGEIILSDSTGGAWPIGINQSVVLSIPENIDVNADDVIFKFSGEGLERKEAFVRGNQVHLVYNRIYTTTPNTIRIKGLKVKSSLKPGFYDILRTAEGTAVQNGNNPDDQVSHGRLWVIPKITKLPYEDIFEKDPTWQAELSSPLWQWGEPNDSRINFASDGQKVLMTNLSGKYEANTHTWLYSPCIDLAGTQNPTLSFDYWADMEREIDGAVMQYSIDRGESWNTLGSDSTGRSWFNSATILANPADQDSSQQLGWTGQTNGWKKAIHRLPDELKIENLRLRLVFRSFEFVNPVDGFNGFAIDNLSISDYQKNVLGELFFQNARDLANTYSELQKQFDDELLTITYPLFAASTEVESRNNFYGRRETNTLILDGQAFYDPPSLVSYPEIDSLSLVEAPFKVEFFPADQYPLQITALKPFSREINIQTVLVEKGAISQGDTLKNLFTKSFPDPAGLSKANWMEGEKTTFNPFVEENLLSVLVNNRPDDFQLIVFLQDAITKQVYQAQAFPLSLVTSITENRDLNHIRIYPNPTKDKVSVTWSKDQTNEVSVKVLDMNGKELLNQELQIGQEIDLKNLENGIYLLVVSTKSHYLVTKPLMVIR